MIGASTRPPAGHTWWAAKERINRWNGSTCLGLIVARLGSAPIVPGPRGLLLASHYRFGFPRAGAFTVGNVVLSQSDWTRLQADRPDLLLHEERHSWQYVLCLGLPFLPAYLTAAAYSLLTTGDPASRNFFERRAGLLIGGYAERPMRPALRRLVG